LERARERGKDIDEVWSLRALGKQLKRRSISRAEFKGICREFRDGGNREEKGVGDKEMKNVEDGKEKEMESEIGREGLLVDGEDHFSKE